MRVAFGVVGLGLGTALLFSSSLWAAEMSTKAAYAFITDYDTGAVLLDKQAEVPNPPASMSKLMTIYILLEKLQAGVFSLDDEFVVSKNAWQKGGIKTGGSTMFLKPDTKVKIRDLLKGIIVQSGNDACIVVAENISGTEEQFTVLMNEKAVELGLAHSHFLNATGWPAEGHQMSSADIALLAKRIIHDFPEYYGVFSEKSFTYNGIKQENRNPLLFFDNIQADGLKTGHTKSSGFGLAASAKDESGRRIIVVVNGLKSMKERGEETRRLITWAMREFANSKLFSRDQVLGKMPVFMGEEAVVNVLAPRDILLTHSKAGAKKIKVKLLYNEPLKAPVKKGDKVGKLVISSPDFATVKVPVVAAEDVDKMGWFRSLWERVKYMVGAGKYELQEG